MIRSFKDKSTYEIARGDGSKRTRRTLPIELHTRARRLIAEIDFAADLTDLARPGNRLHALTGNRRGQHSISINDQFRICFRWKEGEVFDVEITDYH